MSFKKKYLQILFLILCAEIGLTIRIYSQSHPRTIRFGIYTAKITKTNKTELDESLKQWVNGIQRNTKNSWLANTTFLQTLYDSKDQLVTDIENRKIDFMNLSTMDYYGLGLSDFITPILTPSRRESNKYDQYLLITNNRTAISDISKILKAEITLPDAYFTNLMMLWLKVEIHDKVKRKQMKNILLVESSKTENEVLHSVFFGNIEYAVVREATFEIAGELNPQVKNRIRIIAKSPNLITYFLGYRKGFDPETCTAITLEGLNLHKSIDGRQLLNLAQTECLHTLSIVELKETESLINRYKEIFN